jgi:small GTP-binding protein
MKGKICVVGEGGVGKTSLIRRFAFDQFDDKYLKTVGTKVTKVPLTVPRGEGFDVEVDLVLFDIMGQRGFRDMVKDSFFIGAQGLLAVCDLTNPATLEALHEWVTIASEVTGAVPIFLLGNKADLDREGRVPQEALDNFSTIHSAPLFRTSARTGAGVEEAFNLMCVEIVERALKEEALHGVAGGLYHNLLGALRQRGPVGMGKRELFEAFPSVRYDALEVELLRLERDGLVRLNWLGPEEFRAFLTPRGEEAAGAPTDAAPNLPQAVQ